MSKQEKTKHELIRSTSKKAADIGIKVALDLVPGASTAYEIFKLSVGQAVTFLKKNKKKESSSSMKCYPSRMKIGIKISQTRV